jgi:hypothetical protein
VRQIFGPEWRFVCLAEVDVVSGKKGLFRFVLFMYRWGWFVGTIHKEVGESKGIG